MLPAGAVASFLLTVGWLLILAELWMPYPNYGTVGTHQSLHRHYRPQSSSASRLTASHAGFFILSQSLVRPER
jgi:hypothetical protein